MDTGFAGSHEERYSLELPPEESRVSVWGGQAALGQHLHGRQGCTGLNWPRGTPFRTLMASALLHGTQKERP